MIKKILANVILLLLFLSVIVLAFYYYGKVQKEKLSENKIKVIATVGAIAGLLKEIGGLRVEIINLAKGEHAHEVQILPQDIKNIQKAKIIFKIGYRLDDWIDKIAKENNIPLKQLDKNVELIKDKNEINPHYWFSVKNLKNIAKEIYISLVDLDPDHSDYYFKNYQHLIKELDNLTIYEEKFKDIKNRKIIVTHIGFDYLAKELDLKIVGYLKTEEGRDLSVQEFYNLIRKIKDEKIKILIAEKGFLTESVKQFAKIYDLKIVEIDPLEVMDIDKENIVDIMKSNLEKLYENLL
jgi:zinc transport system substrate-binding protein